MKKYNFVDFVNEVNSNFGSDFYDFRNDSMIAVKNSSDKESLEIEMLIFDNMDESEKFINLKRENIEYINNMSAKESSKYVKPLNEFTESFESSPEFLGLPDVKSYYETLSPESKRYFVETMFKFQFLDSMMIPTKEKLCKSAETLNKDDMNNIWLIIRNADRNRGFFKDTIKYATTSAELAGYFIENGAGDYFVKLTPELSSQKTSIQKPYGKENI